jgi:hypothetical protein
MNTSKQTTLNKGEKMLTKEDAEKFADWIIGQEKKMMDVKHPKAEDCDKLTDKQLLEELGVDFDSIH